MSADALDGDVRAELRSLARETADEVGLHLAAAAVLVDEDPEAAYRHAVYARARASRVGSVREAVGIAAYLSGRFAEALAELRTVRRMQGTEVHLPVMADCQRGLGRPERALELAGSPEAARLDKAGQVELRIVASGARADLGQLDAAVLTLQCPELNDARAPWAARLRYAYAEALLAAGREAEGRDWMVRAVDADTVGLTAAAERLAELDGVSFTELVEDGEPEGDTLAAAPVIDEPVVDEPHSAEVESAQVASAEVEAAEAESAQVEIAEGSVDGLDGMAPTGSGEPGEPEDSGQHTLF